MSVATTFFYENANIHETAVQMSINGRLPLPFERGLVSPEQLISYLHEQIHEKLVGLKLQNLSNAEINQVTIPLGGGVFVLPLVELNTDPRRVSLNFCIRLHTAGADRNENTEVLL